MALSIYIIHIMIIDTVYILCIHNNDTLYAGT